MTQSVHKINRPYTFNVGLLFAVWAAKANLNILDDRVGPRGFYPQKTFKLGNKWKKPWDLWDGLKHPTSLLDLTDALWDWIRGKYKICWKAWNQKSGSWCSSTLTLFPKNFFAWTCLPLGLFSFLGLVLNQAATSVSVNNVGVSRLCPFLDCQPEPTLEKPLKLMSFYELRMMGRIRSLTCSSISVFLCMRCWISFHELIHLSTLVKY